MHVVRRFVLTLAWFGAVAVTAPADEGMWLLNDPPRALLKDKYQFDLTDAWLTHAQRASIRFNNGGSGSFVSANGLIVTNHHIGADALQKLSRPGKDLYHDGFYAPTRADELKCPDLELNVLVEMVDVTNAVNAAVKPDHTPEQAFAARRAVLADLEKKSFEQTGLRSDVVTLYQGGLYHLYRYKKYTDVRLVFAPEHGIAFFGGDTDNFEYPRFNLDICFFRAYENNAPVKPEHFLKWSVTGPQANDLVFVTGHPGTTNRLETLAKLKHRRDFTMPYTLNRLRTMEAALLQYAERGPEEARSAGTDIHRVANARKAFAGQYQGLLDPQILARKAADETALRRQVSAKAELNQKAGPAWERIAAVQEKYATFEKAYNLLELNHGTPGELFHIARHLVRLAAELPKPNPTRLREYRDSNLDSLKLSLFSPAPITPSLEQTFLTAGLTFMAEQLGGEKPVVLAALAGLNPANRAAALVRGSKLADVAERKRLFEGGAAAIAASTDPLIGLARLLDTPTRELRQLYESEVEEVERQAYGQIAQARFALLGRTVAPDATFTLRIAFGVVKGYEVDGQELPFHTTFGGAFTRAETQKHQPPFNLPTRWQKGQGKLDLSTPFCFVSTADTIGGNSGSPVLNRAGELVGINFDRNRHGLVRNFVYTDVQARHIAVHSAGVLAALQRLYEVPALLKELTPEPGAR